MKDPVARSLLSSVAYSRPDTLVFLAAFLLGLAYFALAKQLDLEQWVQSAGLVMFGYALFAVLLPRTRFRLDQAGDNVYYLGFLFTLMSMAWALAQFSSTNAQTGAGTEVIITNFGVALSSTIVGIFLRVLLHQMRIDPADFESMSRIELSDATARVRAAMENASLDFARLHEESAQRNRDLLTDMQRQSTAVVEAFAAQLLDANREGLEAMRSAQVGFAQVSAELSTTLREFVEASVAASARLAAVQAPPQRLADGMAEVTASFDALGKRLHNLANDIARVQQSNSRSLADLSRAVDEIRAASRSITTAGSEILQTRADAEQELARHAGALAARLRGVSDAAAANKQALNESAAAARDAFAQIDALLGASNATIGQLRELTVELTDNVRTATRLLGDEPPS